MQLFTRAAQRDEIYYWYFDTPPRALEVRIHCRPGERLQVDTFATPGHGSFAVETLPLADTTKRQAVLQDELACTPPGDGPRAAAVARWLALATFRADALARMIAIAARETSGCELATHALTAIEEHARWVAHHQELSPDPDDWRDVLAVQRIRFEALRSQPIDLGWQSDSARIDAPHATRDVRWVRGPFAAGVARSQGADELYPLTGDVPSRDVSIEWLPVEQRYKKKPKVVVATLGEIRVEVSGFGAELETIARILVAARAAR